MARHLISDSDLKKLRSKRSVNVKKAKSRGYYGKYETCPGCKKVVAKKSMRESINSDELVCRDCE